MSSCRFNYYDLAKAELLQEGIFFLIHFYARDVLEMKKLEIEKLSPLLWHILVLKVEYLVVLVSSISNFLQIKLLGSNLALVPIWKTIVSDLVCSMT